MFDHLLESSRRDDSNKWSNIGFGEVIGILEIEIRTLSGALKVYRYCTFIRPNILFFSFSDPIVWKNATKEEKINKKECMYPTKRPEHPPMSIFYFMSVFDWPALG